MTPDRAAPEIERVTPEQIIEQRAKGWTDFHPEAYCHRCGRPNVWSWSAPSPLWNAVMEANGGDAQWNGIICPPCFAEMADSPGRGAEGKHLWWFAPEAEAAAPAALDVERVRNTLRRIFNSRYHERFAEPFAAEYERLGRGEGA